MRNLFVLKEFSFSTTGSISSARVGREHFPVATHCIGEPNLRIPIEQRRFIR